MINEYIGFLNDLSRFIEYIIENNEIEYKINDIKFSDMLKNISYYKIDEIIDFLETINNKGSEKNEKNN